MANSNEQQVAAKFAKLTLAIGVAFLVFLIWFVLTTDDLPSPNLGGPDGELGGDFTLVSSGGEVSLSDYQGKLVMIYFGFVNCTQVCPVSMRTITTALNRMDESEVEQIQVLLVSIDGADTVEVLDQYTAQFHPNILGLTGNVDQIDYAINEFGAYYDPTNLEEFDIGRAFRHSSRYFIINQEGDFVTALRHSSTPNEIVATLRMLLQ